MVFPHLGNAPPPHDRLPTLAKNVYIEAASIMGHSPRGAAALLRLAVQHLCVQLGEPGHNINSDIASLVSKGLPATVQKSLDVVRVTGNNAVHPGQIDTDDVKVVASLFELINVITEYMIALPEHIDGIYDSLPESSRAQIARRDST